MGHKKNQVSLKDTQVLALSLFGIGFIPKAPGTWGTLAVFPFFYLVDYLKIPGLFFAPLLLLLTVGSCLLAESAQRKYQLHDPQWIVLDEVVGVGLAWLIASPASHLEYFLLFIIFRFFDIVKIWPASFFDQKVLHGSGTIIDDAVSGVYTALTLKLIALVLP